MLIPVAYLGGGTRQCPPPSPLGKSENIFWRDTLLKLGFRTYIFCPQNAGNAVSETQISKYFWGAMPPDPLQLCRHYGLPLTKILATPLVKRGSIIQTFILQRAVTEPFKKQWVRCAHSTLYKPGRFWVTGSLPMAMHCRTTCMINSINTGNTQHGNKRTLDQIHRYSRAKSNSAFYFKNLTID